MSPAIVVVIVSRNTACREMCHLFDGTVNGAHWTDTIVVRVEYPSARCRR